MRTRHLTSTSRALYNVFILPALSKPSASRPLLTHLSKPQSQQRSLQSYRPFTTSPPHRAKTRAPEVRTEKWNEEIPSKIIWLVDPETNTLPEQPSTRHDILARMDKTTHRLVQVGTAPALAAQDDDPFAPDPDPFAPATPGAGADKDEIPVCKIISKKAAYEDSVRRKNLAKEKRKISSLTSSVKTLELNWAIDQNDLGHRLDKLKQFLEEGRKVEVVLAAKKKGRKATLEDCEGVLRRIRGTVGEVKGAREEGEMKGQLGKFCSLGFVGRPVRRKKNTESDDGGD